MVVSMIDTDIFDNAKYEKNNTRQNMYKAVYMGS